MDNAQESNGNWQPGVTLCVLDSDYRNTTLADALSSSVSIMVFNQGRCSGRHEREMRGFFKYTRPDH